MRGRSTVWLGVMAILLLLAAGSGLQARLERTAPPASTEPILYVRSPQVLRRLALGYRTLLADIYWMRAIQYYGGTKLSDAPTKTYPLLYPYLDLTTGLDPQFRAVYVFGSIFLAEAPPGGAGRPDLSAQLIQKGLAARPGDWVLAQQMGFVHYWWIRDYRTAAAWFERASRMPNAPDWLVPMAALTTAQGGDRGTSRQLWHQALATADSDWMREAARYKLAQLDVLDEIDAVQRIVDAYTAFAGAPPRTWAALVAARRLRGIPVDPTGEPLVLGPEGKVALSEDSRLHPLPQEVLPDGR